MSRLSIRYLAITFTIMIVAWGACVICSANDITLQNNTMLYVPYLLGGLSPTIASYLALKSLGIVTGFQAWLKHIFDFKHGLFSYLAVMMLAAVYYVSQSLISGYQSGAPLWMILVLLPAMLFGGGLEEAGWRYILQPEMEKRFPFWLSALSVGVIWWIWHLPLFYIAGTGQSSMNFFLFGVSAIALSFALATIKKISNSVWLCVLFHCLTNALSGIFIINNSVAGYMLSAIALILASSLVLAIAKKNSIFT